MKERVLSMLEGARGLPVSGGALAAQLGVTRSAVWKAVRALQEAGHSIEAVPGRGYTLAAQDDVITVPAVHAKLCTAALGRTLQVLPSVDSTNTLLKKMAQEGAVHGTAVIAERQSAGRGRLSRSFYSPGGSGLYMSVLLRPSLALEEAVRVTCAAAVAAARAIERQSGVQCRIKWVNDLYVGTKKVCGILTEAGMDLESRRLGYLVVGIGINITPPEEGFPDELRGVAGALGARQPVLRAQLAAEILNELEPMMDALPSADFMEEYSRRSLVTGRDITVHSAQGARKAKAIGITQEGHLLVQFEGSDKTEALHTGEISVRLAGGEGEA